MDKAYEVPIRSQFLPHELIVILNEGQDIRETNFWETRMAKNGHFFVSIQSDAIRLLLPETMVECIGEMKTGSHVILSYNDSDYELLFEDQTNHPFLLRSPILGIDSKPLWQRREGLEFSAWTSGCVKVLEMEARVREVEYLPCLHGW